VLRPPDDAVRDLARVEARKRDVAAEAVSAIRRVSTARVTGVLRAHSVLMELLDHDDPKVRLSAAHQLHTAHSVVSSIEFEERLLRVEGRLETPGGRPPPTGWQL
jgi:hypothetical protein